MAMVPDRFNEDIRNLIKSFGNRKVLLDGWLCSERSETTITDTDKIEKIKDLVKKCVNLNIYIDGENVFKKILKICEGEISNDTNESSL